MQRDELAKLIKKHLWHKARIACYKNAQLPVFCFESKLKNCAVALKAYVVFGKCSDEDAQDIHILINNDLALSHKRVVNLYMQRWGIEQTFQELKDVFYFDHYQVRHQEKIMRYWILCILAWSLIYWIKQNAYLNKVVSTRVGSFNDYKQLLLKLILFSSYAALRKNKLLFNAYFAEIKSQRFKNRCYR